MLLFKIAAIKYHTVNGTFVGNNYGVVLLMLCLVARRVAEKQTVAYEGQTFHVELRSSARDVKKQHKRQKHDLFVTGIPIQLPEHLVELFFETPKHSDGGSVEKLTYNPETGSALVSFQETAGEIFLLK